MLLILLIKLSAWYSFAFICSIFLPWVLGRWLESCSHGAQSNFSEHDKSCLCPLLQGKGKRKCLDLCDFLGDFFQIVFLQSLNRIICRALKCTFTFSFTVLTLCLFSFYPNISMYAVAGIPVFWHSVGPGVFLWQWIQQIWTRTIGTL